MTDEILPADELEDRRDNRSPRCSGCGCIPRFERDGMAHWWHKPDCPVMARITEATTDEDEDEDRS